MCSPFPAPHLSPRLPSAARPASSQLLLRLPSRSTGTGIAPILIHQEINQPQPHLLRLPPPPLPAPKPTRRRANMHARVARLLLERLPREPPRARARRVRRASDGTDR